MSVHLILDLYTVMRVDLSLWPQSFHNLILFFHFEHKRILHDLLQGLLMFCRNVNILVLKVSFYLFSESGNIISYSCMKLIKTAKIKLNISKEDVLPTMLAYTKAFNYIFKIGYSNKKHNGIYLHNKTYDTVREYLPAQLAISARSKAAEALKSSRKKRSWKKDKINRCPHSKLCAIRLDIRSYSLFLHKKEVSILTIDGRKK